MVLLKTPEILVLQTVIQIWFFSVLSGLLLAFFCACFISCSFDLVCFLPLLAIEKCLPISSDRRQISSKTPTMRLTKGHHGKLNGQNRNKMSEDRQRKLISNRQQFNKWIKQIIGFLTYRFFRTCFLFRVLLFLLRF